MDAHDGISVRSLLLDEVTPSTADTLGIDVGSR